MKLDQWLKEHWAPPKEQEFAARFTTLEELWNALDNLRWMFGVLQHIVLENDPRYRMFACWCVRHTPVSDSGMFWDWLDCDISRDAVNVADDYLRGNATRNELEIAVSAAWDHAQTTRNSAVLSAALCTAWGGEDRTKASFLDVTHPEKYEDYIPSPTKIFLAVESISVFLHNINRVRAKKVQVAQLWAMFAADIAKKSKEIEAASIGGNDDEQ